MRCEGFDKLIHLFLDGRLDRGNERKLSEHLSECERCTKKLAFLESVEGKAKKIEAKEPPQEYWDTFASRVREKIEARKEKSPLFGLKKATESIFTFSPLKIRVAAGLVSVVLVFIIGKLYVDYRGQEILPPKTVIETEKQPQPDILKGERKEGFPAEEARDKTGVISEKREIDKEPAAPVPPESKDLLPKGAEGEKEYLQKKQPPPVEPQLAEEKLAPAHAPAVPVEAPKEAEKPSEQAIISPEADQTGAGVEKKPDEALDTEARATEKKARGGEESATQEELGQLIPKSISAPAKLADRTLMPADHYVVNETTIPRIEEHDTLMQEDDLRRAIHTWKAHIEQNPADSLSREGYLQIATAYYLLAKLSQDTTIISEGSELIEEYLDQIEDRVLKDELSNKVMNIKALRQR